jgi:hypothetical protein
VQSVAFITFVAIAIVQGAVVLLALVSLITTLPASLMMSYGHDLIGAIVSFNVLIKSYTHLLIRK